MIFIVVALFLFAATVALVGALTARKGEQTVEDLKGRVGAVSGPKAATQPMALERDERLSAFPAVDRLLRRLSVARKLELLLYQGGFRMRVGAFLLLVAFCAMAGYLAGLAMFHGLLQAICLFFLGGALPLFYAQNRKAGRLKAFAEEFPDALDLLVGALRAGISFTGALQIVADESPEPIRSEFAIVVEEQSLGIDLREALQNMAERVGSLDLKFFVTAVILQRTTGGNLTEVLENTSALIRDRFRILGDIQTFTAQGRFTGWVLGLLPTGMSLFLLTVAPDFFHKMLDNPQGRTVLGFAFLLQVLGFILINRIVNIRV